MSGLAASTDADWRLAPPAPPAGGLSEPDLVYPGPNGDAVTVRFPAGRGAGALQLRGPGIGHRYTHAELSKVGAMIGAALAGDAATTVVAQPGRSAGGSGLVGSSPAFLEAVALIDRVADRGLPVLLIGESGTGKELFARTLHQRSPRRAEPFLALNCGSVTPTLLESELFGYEKGAFTGAARTTKGLFESADRGTLLLDEVNGLTPEAQVSLLRVLQEGEIRRVGGSRAVPVDVRVVATCPLDLAICVERGQFRADLYYRLNVFPIRLPALRERREDIPLLAQQFLDQIAARDGLPRLAIAAEAMDGLVRRSWPGNIRELRGAIERAAVLARGGVVRAEDLASAAAVAHAEPLQVAARQRKTLEEVELAYIFAALRENGYSRARTARQLGISTNTLWRRLKQAGFYDSDEARSSGSDSRDESGEHAAAR